MSYTNIPDFISHDVLLQTMQSRSNFDDDGQASVYNLQLRHNLLALARKAHVEVMVEQLTDMPIEEITSKSLVELLVILDRARGVTNTDFNRYW